LPWPVAMSTFVVTTVNNCGHLTNLSKPESVDLLHLLLVLVLAIALAFPGQQLSKIYVLGWAISHRIRALLNLSTEGRPYAKEVEAKTAQQ
jgi:hypothetical protein